MVWRKRSIFASIGLLVLVAFLAPTKTDARTRRRRTVRRATPQASRFPALILPGNASDRDRLVADACLRALGNRRGSVMAMDPRTGRVLALVNPRWACSTPLRLARSSRSSWRSADCPRGSSHPKRPTTATEAAGPGPDTVPSPCAVPWLSPAIHTSSGWASNWVTTGSSTTPNNSAWHDLGHQPDR